MDDIYREELMEHYKNPQNKGQMEDPTEEKTGNNPFCGDVVTIQLKIDDGTIQDIKFDGHACAVSVASASILTDEVKGKPLSKAKEMSKDRLLELLGVELTTSRIKCAELPLDTFLGMLEGIED